MFREILDQVQVVAAEAQFQEIPGQARDDGEYAFRRGRRFLQSKNLLPLPTFPR